MAKRQEAKKKYTAGNEDFKNAMKEIRTNRMTELKKILTPDQLAKLKAAHKANAGGKGGMQEDDTNVE